MLEALHLRRILVVVPNASLMDNHQAEVAKALADSGYLIQSSPTYDHGIGRGVISRTLAKDIAQLKERGMDRKVLQPFPTHGNRKFAQVLDEEMGFVTKVQ